MRLFLSLFLSVISLYGISQSVLLDLEEFAENLFAVQDEDLDYEDLYESLSAHYVDPLNLNTATKAELESLYILSQAQVNAFLDHRRKYGDLLSVYELQSIDRFTLNTIMELIPFIIVEESIHDNRGFIKRILSEKENYLLLRYSPGRKSDSEDSHLGNPDHFYARFRVRHKDDFSIGFTMEKDAGEVFWNDSIKGFDFYSYHFQLEERGILNSLIFGDFQMQAGQGLIFGAGFSPGKGATISSIRRSNIGLRPYTSARESGFFRGVAGTLKKGSFKFTGFLSSNNQDARIQTDSLENTFSSYIQSIQQTGLHRTISEISARDQVRELSIGASMVYEISRSINIGINHINIHYDREIIPAERKYNQFEFRGNQNQNTGIFFNTYYQSMAFFGEIARSSSGGMGGVLGVTAVLHPTIETSVLYRNYTPDFHSFYGNGFGENSRNINEKGVYWGISFTPDRYHQFNAYYDTFTFPWLKFRVDAPSSGNEFFFRYTYTPTRDIEMFLQLRRETKDRNTTNNESTLPVIMKGQKSNYVASAKYQLNEWLTMKTRIQFSTFLHQTKTNGMAMAHDLRLTFNKLRLTGRMAIFDAENFDNRQYMFENDVLFAFSVPAYYGRGIRSYLLLNYKWNSNISCWVKYGRYFYEYSPATEGPGKTDHFRIQLRLSL